MAKGVILAADESRYSYQQEDVKSVNEDGGPVVLNQVDEVDLSQKLKPQRRYTLQKQSSLT